ncbi:MAG: hypothetical protein QM638_07870 [Nocardioides sp.]|uniref:DUF6758 family protein n=1 Tax=Nocardioides sp. TaxID=35761 RepID=UPI0039E63A3F
MALLAGCPRCTASVTAAGDGWSCPEHGGIRPVWRPDRSAYDAFVEHLGLADGFPTYLPWPLASDWWVADFGVVAAGPGDDHATGELERPIEGQTGSQTGSQAWATLTAVAGTSLEDGDVEVLIVTEEAGVGLGSRCARVLGSTPGPELGRPAAWIRVGGQQVPLWTVGLWQQDGPGGPGGQEGEEWDRSVLVGEVEGRWLWLVFRPASAMLMLGPEWALRDVSGLGMSLVELPFGGGNGGW